MTDILKKFDLSGKFDGLLNEGIFEDSEVPGTGKEEPEFGNHYSEDDQFYGTADVDGSGAYDETAPDYGIERSSEIVRKILNGGDQFLKRLLATVDQDYKEMHGNDASAETSLMIKRGLMGVAKKILMVQAKGRAALNIDYDKLDSGDKEEIKKYNAIISSGKIQSPGQYSDHFNEKEEDFDLYVYPNFRYKENVEDAQMSNTFYEPKYILFLKLDNRYETVSEITGDPRISIHQNDISADFIDAYRHLNEIKQYIPNDFLEKKMGVSSESIFGKKCNIFFLNTENYFTVFSSTARDLNTFKKAIIDKSSNNLESKNYNIIDVEFTGESLNTLEPYNEFFESKSHSGKKIIEESDEKDIVELEPGTFFVRDDVIYKKLKKTKDVTDENSNPFSKMMSVIVKYAATEYGIDASDEEIEDYASLNTARSNNFYKSMNMVPIWKVPNRMQYGLFEMWSRPAIGWGHVMSPEFDDSIVFISSFGYRIRMSKEELQTYKNFRSIILSNQYPELTKYFLEFKKMILSNGYLPYFSGRVPDEQINDIVASTMFIDGKPEIYRKKTYYTEKGVTSKEHTPVFSTFGNNTIFAAEIDDNTGKVIYYKEYDRPEEYANSSLSVDHIDGNHNNNFYQNLRLSTSDFNTAWSNRYGSIVFTMTPSDLCLSNPEYSTEMIKWTFEFNEDEGIIMPVGTVENRNILLTSENIYEGLYIPSISGKLGALSGKNNRIATGKMTDTISISTPIKDIRNDRERIFFLDVSEILGNGYQKTIKGQTEKTDLNPEDIQLLKNTMSKKESPIVNSNNMSLSVLNKIIEEKYSDYKNWFNVQIKNFVDDDEFNAAYNKNYIPRQSNAQQADQNMAQQQNQTNAQSQENYNAYPERNMQVSEATKKDDKEEEEEAEGNTLISRFVKFGQKFTFNASDTLRFIKSLMIENASDDSIIRVSSGKDIFVEIGIRKRNEFIKEIERDLSNWRGNYFVSFNKGQRDSSLNPIWYGIFPRSSSVELPAISVTGKFGMVHMTQNGPKIRLERTGAYSSVYPFRPINKEELLFVKNSNESFESIVNKAKAMTPRKAPLKNDSDLKTSTISLHRFSASSWKLGVFKRQIEYLKGSQTYGSNGSGKDNYSPLIVHHINGIQSDFRPENLTWITPENNTAFDSGVGIALYRITPGTGEEVPIRVWFTKSLYDNDTTKIYDTDLPGGPYEIKKIKLYDKTLDNARSHSKFLGGTEYTYVYRRVLVKDTDREFPYMRGRNEEEIRKKKIASIVAVEYDDTEQNNKDKDDNGQKKKKPKKGYLYRSVDQFDRIIPSELDLDDPNMIMYHYIRGRVSPTNKNNEEAMKLIHDIFRNVMANTSKYDNLEQVQYLKNIVFNKGAISDKTIRNGGAIEEALSAKIMLLKGFSVADNIEPEYQNFIWNLDDDNNFKYISDPELAKKTKESLIEMVLESKIDPDSVPLCIINECMKHTEIDKSQINFKHKQGRKPFKTDEPKLLSMDRFNLGMKHYRQNLRRNYVNVSKFYSDDENPYEKAVKRLKEKRERRKNNGII